MACCQKENGSHCDTEVLQSIQQVRISVKRTNNMHLFDIEEKGRFAKLI